MSRGKGKGGNDCVLLVIRLNVLIFDNNSLSIVSVLVVI